VIGHARFNAPVSERRLPLGYRGVVPVEPTGDVLLAQEEPEFSVHAPVYLMVIVESPFGLMTLVSCPARLLGEKKGSTVDSPFNMKSTI
jgi:hypothetical protein